MIEPLVFVLNMAPLSLSPVKEYLHWKQLQAAWVETLDWDFKFLYLESRL